MRNHLFEFMDQEWVPDSLRTTLREILEACNSLPFRFYNRWITSEIKQQVEKGHIKCIVELGAGTAPLTQALLNSDLPPQILLKPSDINPDLVVFNGLQKKHPHRVQPMYEAYDFSIPRLWPSGTLLVLSATFHHLKPQQRIRVIRALNASNTDYLIAEPINHNLLSYLSCVFGIIAALATPVLLINKPGRLRRFLWCWLMPIAGLMFVWDGLVSCHRVWSKNELELVLTCLNDSQSKPNVKSRPIATLFLLAGHKASQDAATKGNTDAVPANFNLEAV